jgi:PhnB protein
MTNKIRTSLAPWLSVRDSVAAVAFYKSAFGAIETYKLEGEAGGIIARLSIQDAEFWVSEGGTAPEGDENVGGHTIRMILTVEEPEAFFEKALNAGAKEIFPVGEEHGWKLGRLVDPFGLHWEIGHQIS